jgi:sporulation and spore germination protein
LIFDNEKAGVKRTSSFTNMPPKIKWAIAALCAAVLIGLFYLPRLWRGARDLGKPATSDEQARREIVQPPIVTSTDVKVQTKLFWISASNPSVLDAEDVSLPLSADPVQRARQLVNALILSPPSPQQRTLPADAALLDFYLLSDGTAIADFADTLSTGTPSGIMSEQLAVDSITKTLAASVPQIRRLKILLQGQEAESLAGHVDLTGFLTVRAAASTLPAPAPPPAAPAAAPSAKPGT